MYKTGLLLLILLIGGCASRQPESHSPPEESPSEEPSELTTYDPEIGILISKLDKLQLDLDKLKKDVDKLNEAYKNDLHLRPIDQGGHSDPNSILPRLRNFSKFY